MERPANPYRALEVEWALLGETADARRQLRSWADRHQELDRFATPRDVVAACHERTDPQRANQLLAALLAEAADDPLARRAVLQAMLPALAGITRRCWPAVGAGRTWAEVAEVDQEVLTTAHDQILRLAQSAPPPSWPATAILDATWRRMRTAIDRHRRHTTAFMPLPEDDPVSEPTPRADEELMEVVAEALRAGAIGEEPARLVVRTRLLGFTPAEEAAALGCTLAWVYKQRERAEQALVSVGADMLRAAS